MYHYAFREAEQSQAYTGATRDLAACPVNTAPQQQAADDASFSKQLSGLMSFLNKYAHTQCKDRELARDLSQQALLKAWQSRSSFRPGTNLKAWLFTILRNLVYSHHRRAWREVGLSDHMAGLIPDADSPQEWSVMAADALCALRAIPTHQRQAVLLIGAGGLSHAEAAELKSCAVGTIKSRVTRGRKAIAEQLDKGTRLPQRSRAENACVEILDELRGAANTQVVTPLAMAA